MIAPSVEHDDLVAGDLPPMEAPDIRRYADGPLGSFPGIDQRGRWWGPADVVDYWRRLCRDGMTRMIRQAADRGQDPADPKFYAAASLSLEASVRAASAGRVAGVALVGAHEGFADAACAFWQARAREQTLAAFAEHGFSNRTWMDCQDALEAAALGWCGRCTQITGRVLDAVHVGLSEACEHRQHPVDHRNPRHRHARRIRP